MEGFTIGTMRLWNKLEKMKKSRKKKLIIRYLFKRIKPKIQS
jgi:hypothetical protein